VASGLKDTLKAQISICLDRKMVLKYHPDKKKPGQEPDIPKELNLHEYFTCITKAFEQLSTLENRQAFDSVDPTLDETTPTSFNPNKQDFFKVFEPVFERNSRYFCSQLFTIMSHCGLEALSLSFFFLLQLKSCALSC